MLQLLVTDLFKINHILYTYSSARGVGFLLVFCAKRTQKERISVIYNRRILQQIQIDFYGIPFQQTINIASLIAMPTIYLIELRKENWKKGRSEMYARDTDVRKMSFHAFVCNSYTILTRVSAASRKRNDRII